LTPLPPYFLVRPHEQIAEFARFQERLAIDVALFAPTLAVRPDFGLEKSPRGFSELLVLGLEDVAAHGQVFSIFEAGSL